VQINTFTALQVTGNESYNYPDYMKRAGYIFNVVPDPSSRNRRETMTKPAKSHPQPDTAYDEAMRIARGTQRPGQTREQTKLIAKGIRNGIEQYKKRQSAKARELDRNRKKVKQQLNSPEEKREILVEEKRVYRWPWLPWILLVLSWLAFASYWFVKQA